MKKLQFGVIVAVLACLSILMLAPTNVSAASTSKAASAPHTITAPVSGSASNGDIFTGTLTITHFVSIHKALYAVGTIRGRIKRAAGANKVASTVNPQITIPTLLPVAAAAGSCSVLALTLGPLDLNLLGLVVHLNQVVLNITALPGGGLLGSLLCSVAGLLNGGTPLSGLVALLNQILAAL